MELQSFHGILAIIAILNIIMNIFTFIRKFPHPAYLGFSTLINLES